MPTLLELTGEHREWLLRHSAAWDITGGSDSCFSFAAQRRMVVIVLETYNGYPLGHVPRYSEQPAFPSVKAYGKSPAMLEFQITERVTVPGRSEVALHHRKVRDDVANAAIWLDEQGKPFTRRFAINDRTECGEALRAVLWVADHYGEWMAMLKQFNAAVAGLDLKDAGVEVLVRELAEAQRLGKLLRTSGRDSTYPRLVAYYRARLQGAGIDPDRVLLSEFPVVDEEAMVG